VPALFKILLVSHVIAGLLAIIASYAVWMGLLKRELSAKFLTRTSWFAAVMIWVSWLAGGYYYWAYYGQSVKTVIIQGRYAWAHSVFMESKEHVFLFLPFLYLVLAIVISGFSDRLTAQPDLKKQLALLAAINAILGIIITLSGVVISGAVR